MKATDFLRKFESAVIPSRAREPRISGRAMGLDASSSMCRCCANLGHSRRMCSLVSSVVLSQGQVIGSGDRGRKDRRKSPVYATLASAALYNAAKDLFGIFKLGISTVGVAQSISRGSHSPCVSNLHFRFVR